MLRTWRVAADAERQATLCAVGCARGACYLCNSAMTSARVGGFVAHIPRIAEVTMMLPAF